jgi:hypothetical protein
MLVNLSDYLIHLKPVKYFAFVSDSEFVSSSPVPLSFDFAMEWTLPKTSDFVTHCPLAFVLVNQFGLQMYSGFVRP